MSPIRLTPVFAAIVATTLVARTAFSKPISAWPVRLNLSMPFGYTWGTARLHGFTWGFRGAASGYTSPHGLGLGGYAEMRLDAATHSESSLGASISYPIHHIDEDFDLRAGAYAGPRWGETGRSLAAGVVTAVEVPAYLYDLRLGVRLDLTFDGGHVASTSVLFDLDLAVVVGGIAAASSASR